MKVIQIDFPTSLSETNIKDDNIDIIVTLEDGNTYVLIVATPQNVSSLMDNYGLPYLPAGFPFVFVSTITRENISLAVESFAAEDAYWIKYYHNAGENH